MDIEESDIKYNIIKSAIKRLHNKGYTRIKVLSYFDY